MKKTKNIIYVFIIWIVNCLVSIGFVKLFIASQNIISVKKASDNIGMILLQNIAENVVPILIIIFMIVKLKSSFMKDMSLKIYNKQQIYIVAGLSCVLVCIFIYFLITKTDKVSVLYQLFYYLIFISFMEEFIFRGLFSYLLKDLPVAVRYIIPNVLFALSHYASTINFSAFTVESLLTFIARAFLGYFIMGLALQFLKEKTGTLWIPIIIHAICDFL